MAQSCAQVSLCGPVVRVRYGDGSVHEFGWDRLRLTDFDGSVPWRRARTRRGQVHYSGAYFSATTGGLVAYESRLELARLLLADFDPRVRWIYAQPFLRGCRYVALGFTP